jgi:hypothetical protein
VTATNDLRQMPGELMHDLNQLARRFPEGFIEHKDGIDYVAHHVVTQRLLSIVGPFDFELVEIIRGDVAAATPDPNGRNRRARTGTSALRNVVVGGVWRLTCEVDGHRVRIEEVGDVGDVHNWPHDGARLKDAASDALKRCAMRLGLGLHLWAQEHYFLDRQLRAILEVSGSTAEAEEAASRPPGPVGEGSGDPEAPAAEPSAGQAPGAAAEGAAGRAEEHDAKSTDSHPGVADQRAADGRQRRDRPTGGGRSRRPGRDRRSAPADDSAQDAKQMPVRGMAE